MSHHPRFPDAMSATVRRTVADEVDVTLAAFPSKRSLEAAITAYAEQLDGFDHTDDVRIGFRDARARATEYAPSPSQVRQCVGLACRTRRQRQERIAAHKPDEPQTFCMCCHTRDLIEIHNGRLMPFHADNCPGLHESDRLDMQHALVTNRGIWRNGAEPKRLLTAEAAD